MKTLLQITFFIFGFIMSAVGVGLVLNAPFHAFNQGVAQLFIGALSAFVGFGVTAFLYSEVTGKNV